MTICELGPGLWFGQLHPGEQLLTAIKCSRMQPQSSLHYPPAQENAWSGGFFLQKSAWPTAAKHDFSSLEHCRSTSSICTSHGADSTSTSKGEVKSLKSSLYSILLNNLSLLRCRCLRYRCLRCHGYLGSDKRRATKASDWPLLINTQEWVTGHANLLIAITWLLLL